MMFAKARRGHRCRGLTAEGRCMPQFASRYFLMSDPLETTFIISRTPDRPFPTWDREASRHSGESMRRCAKLNLRMQRRMTVSDVGAEQDPWRHPGQLPGGSIMLI